MSKTQILDELPRLKTEDRQEILDKLLELEGAGWIADSDLADEERQLIESRLEAHRRNPDAVVPWEDVEAKLLARLGK